MASRAANRAVHEYRQLKKAEFKIRKKEIALHKYVTGLSEEDFHEYAVMTTEIDAAIDHVEDTAPDSVFSNIINRAGMDDGARRS